MHNDNQSKSKQRHIPIKEEILKFKTSFIFYIDIPVSSSFELCPSRNRTILNEELMILLEMVRMRSISMYNQKTG